MANLEFRLILHDEESIRKGHGPVEFGMSVMGTTEEQRRSAITLLQTAARKIEEHTVKKFGTGEILPEPQGDDSEGGNDEATIPEKDSREEEDS